MVEEKTVTINLRRKLLETGKWRRNKVAISRIREMLEKTSKAERVVFEKKLADRIFVDPLQKSKIRIVKIDDKSVRAELVE